MKRNLTQLASQPYELLVIGGGIYGACIARDAILRGLQVALVDEGDFGHATSANSLKTIHGGLRYLQDANLKLVRLMINERKAFMRVAPHLVHHFSLNFEFLSCKQVFYVNPSNTLIISKETNYFNVIGDRSPLLSCR